MSTSKFEDRQAKLDLNGLLWTDYDERPGIRTFVGFEGDKVISQTLQNPESIFDANYQERENDNWDALKDWKKVASVPISQWLEWEKLGITQDSQALLKAIETEKELKTTKRRVA